MSKVFLVDTNKQPLDPVHPGWARKLLSTGQAAVYRRYPFTLILKRAVEHPKVQLLRLKIDPGARTTGLALVNDASGEVVFAAELAHRGQAIKHALDARRAIRKHRRQRKTRYRPARFKNRRRKRRGWLPPSLESRLANILTWVRRLRRFCYIAALSQELVKFDTHLMQNPEVSGVDYQQGTLAGYEVREYLLEKWNRRCAYCSGAGVPLEVEHLVPKSRGGTNNISNLVISCRPCNQSKGVLDVQAFLKDRPEVLRRVQSQAKAPLRDATAVNATRWALYERLRATGLPVEVGSGGRTKWNRTSRALPKTHWCDAANVGASTPETLIAKGVCPLQVRATGHGRRQMCVTDHGFPRQHKERRRQYLGFQTGDIVKAVILRGKYAGTYVGRVAIRFRPSFRLGGFDVHPKYLRALHRSDGYDYNVLSQQKKGGGASPSD
ncbi:MAG TPA: RNA-guided endonuclease IscB [Ktedonobacteraceae bacterium]